MNITLNNLSSPTGLITFTDIPNILKVEDDGYGSKAELVLSVGSGLNSVTNADGQWFISFMGETITNVLSPANAINKNFYVSTGATSTAASIARAFRNCSTVAAYFNISSNGATVNLKAKAIGQVGIQNTYSTNIANQYLSASVTEGSANSSLFGAKVDVDIYSGDDYITTLEKNYYGSEVAFNLSPVLTTFAEYGRQKPFQLSVYSIINGNYTLLGNLDTNYVSIGYMVNQGNKFLFNDLNIAQNFSRGENQDADNNTILYIYKPQIDLSIYMGNNGGFSYNIDYLDSAFNVIYSTGTQTAHRQSNTLIDETFYLNHSGYAYFPLSFYIDLTISSYKIRYKVIKPLKATEYYQRVYWRNSYGGISFFDFTGQKTESRDLDVSTYEKNIFGYYTDDKNELEKIYNNEVKYTVTLKSHLIENDGKYIFNDLLQSANVWTEINGENYAIIIDSITVDETDNNNIYEATVKYHYSQEPSLI